MSGWRGRVRRPLRAQETERDFYGAVQFKEQSMQITDDTILITGGGRDWKRQFCNFEDID
jgi:hypothetical protein